MAVTKGKRLSQIARELNVGIQHLVDFLSKKGHEISPRPNTKITGECYELLLGQFKTDKSVKEELQVQRKKVRSSEKVKESEKTKSETKEVESTPENVETETNTPSNIVEEETISVETEKTEVETPVKLKVLGKIDLDSKKSTKEKEPETKQEETETTIPEIKQEAVVTEKEEKQEKPETKSLETAENIETKTISETKNVNPEPIEPVEVSKTDTEKHENQHIENVIPVEEKPTKKQEETPIETTPETIETKEEEKQDKDSQPIKVLGHIDLDSLNQKVRPDRKKTGKERHQERLDREQASKDALEKAKNDRQKQAEDKIKEDQLKAETDKKNLNAENFIETKVEKLTGPTVVGKIELKEEKKPDKNKKKQAESRRKKRKRIRKPVDEKSATKETSKDGTKETATRPPRDTSKDAPRRKNIGTRVTPKRRGAPVKKQEVAEEDVNAQVKETLAKLTSKSKKKAVKHRREKRKDIRQKIQDEFDKQEHEKSVLKVTEFVSANELATMMDVSVNSIISTCFELGKMVTINSRMDAELIAFIAEEYGFIAEFISANDNEVADQYEDTEEEMMPRPPIVTVMGHVDHGKTSLLDFIRKENVIAGEAGGITQHIGAYSVKMDKGKITFLDTPGHEAFTAMRARGAKVTDIAIIIVAADDNIMPQTEEAINHAKAAEVPIIFAINKIDKDGANPEKIKEALAGKNLLVEDWGGTYQSTEISAKFGKNVDKLLEEVILAAEMLELKANPNRPAKGTVIEASLDRGRGFVATVLVQTGTLKVGDIVLAGSQSGRIKAMFNEHNQKITEAGPSEPVLILGLDGAPQAGDLFHVFQNEKEARDIATKNKRLQREQSLRAQKHITLDEIGRRLKLGSFQQLNVIIKGDVTGSIEAIADSLSKLSTEEIQLNVIHKGVGQISEADVMLAAASDAIILGFQVRPSTAARKLAENEEIDIRLYSIIYDAISEVKAAMEGMLSPEIKEEITATIEIREVFKITKVGKIAGCYVLDGKVTRDEKIRLIRDGIVVHTGKLGSLKRFKDDVKEVARGYECGLNLHNYEDIKEGDIIESFKEVEVAKKL